VLAVAEDVEHVRALHRLRRAARRRRLHLGHRRHAGLDRSGGDGRRSDREKMATAPANKAGIRSGTSRRNGTIRPKSTVQMGYKQSCRSPYSTAHHFFLHYRKVAQTLKMTVQK